MMMMDSTNSSEGASPYHNQCRVISPQPAKNKRRKNPSRRTYSRPCHAFQPLLLLFVVILLAAFLPNANAYANWLKCYVDLDDTEVVMNKKILTHDNADHIVELQVQRVDSQDNNAEWETANIAYPAHKTSTWKVKVKPPPALQGQNMQFVVEAEATFNDGSSTKSVDAESATGFTFPKMCQGRRSFGRNYNEAVTLEISGSASPDSIEIWAAWAIGHGQVSLTPRLVLMLGDAEEEEEEEL